MRLGDKILKLRKQNGLSQEKLGEKLNVTRQTISNWELGETLPNPEQLKLLSKYLNVSIDELLDNEVSNKKEILNNSNKNGFNTIIKYIGIFFCDIFVIAGFILLYAWLLVMGLFSLSSLVVAICLIFRFNIGNLIPFMPYWCGFISAISLICLSILFVLCSVLYAVFLKRLVCSYGNIHRFILSNEFNKSNEYNNKKISIFDNKKILISVKIFLISFILSFMLSIIVCMISSGTLSFWHTWNWWV